MKNTFTVIEVPNSKRNTKNNYSVAIIGRPKYEIWRDCWNPDAPQNKNSGVKNLKELYDRYVKLCETPIEKRSYEVLQWSKNIKNALTKFESHKKMYAFVKIVKTVKL